MALLGLGLGFVDAYDSVLSSAQKLASVDVLEDAALQGLSGGLSRALSGELYSRHPGPASMLMTYRRGWCS